MSPSTPDPSLPSRLPSRHSSAVPSSLRTATRWGLAAAGVGAVVGAGLMTYAHRVGLTRFTTRFEQLEILPPGQVPLRILHISDIHYVPGQEKKFAWLRALAELQPDLVVNTGDNLSHPDAVDEVLEALAPLRRFPGVYVPGSNDYYGPRLKNPLSYLRAPSEHEPDRLELPWRRLFAAFGASGWVSLSNRHHAMTVGATPVLFSGVDDPHIGRDRFSGWPRGVASSKALRLGVAHAPVSRILSRFADAGADLILSGHTHGGQVCLPGGRALTTNCDLPTTQASGLSTVTSTGGRKVPLHVSAGIGTSATAPIRFNCPPEATVLDLFPHR
ncbi:metallophosphoesterase [Nesterenkonia sp. PF2B19]|uniref:metallophosphoesterase n=1 Tax=unclassified Nesterenkonia TaxID=2629769 RepID=UPI0009F3B1C7|nr:metallophosphoesterase [Nesterenkonia sp. PF2B19]OSM44068.1 metallophosphoesterase [Nesterenkonia sp. PF2B19]